MCKLQTKQLILGKEGGYRFITWSNKSIVNRPIGRLSNGEVIYRRPIFDIDVRAEKKDPYTQNTQNEILKDLYSMGVFDPQNAVAASILLSAMDFSGVEQVRERIERQAGLVGEMTQLPTEQIADILSAEGLGSLQKPANSVKNALSAVPEVEL